MVSYKQHLQQMSKLTTRVVQRGARYHRNVLFLYCYYSIVLLTGHLLLTMGCIKSPHTITLLPIPLGRGGWCRWWCQYYMLGVCNNRARDSLLKVLLCEWISAIRLRYSAQHSAPSELIAYVILFLFIHFPPQKHRVFIRINNLKITMNKTRSKKGLDHPSVRFR